MKAPFIIFLRAATGRGRSLKQHSVIAPASYYRTGVPLLVWKPVIGPAYRQWNSVTLLNQDPVIGPDHRCWAIIPFFYHLPVIESISLLSSVIYHTSIMLLDSIPLLNQHHVFLVESRYLISIPQLDQRAALLSQYPWFFY